LWQQGHLEIDMLLQSIYEVHQKQDSQSRKCICLYFKTFFFLSLLSKLA
jgi:hypothetical protein